jgi:hypothetical protein
MIKRIGSQIAVTALTMTLFAGCGSSGSSTSSPVAAPAGTTAASASSSSTGGNSGTQAASGTAGVASEILTCTSTAARSKLTTSGKAAYLTLCKQAVTGHAPAAKREAAQQCQEIIKTTVPAASQPPLDALCLKV